MARNVVVSKKVDELHDRGISKWKLALGAASLFFFVVGVKRSFRTDDGREILQKDAEHLEAPVKKESRRKRRPHE